MQYRKVPKTGDEISTLAFGCMRFPLAGKKIDRERSSKLLHQAIDEGVNYLDTAMPYHDGESEPFLGDFLSDTPGLRDRLRIATKLPPWLVKSHDDMDPLLGGQLKKLKTDRIDYYLLHALDADNWAKLRDLGVRDFLDRAKASGRIVNAGFSYHGDSDTFREIVDAYDWTFCQIQYNLLDEQHQAGTAGLEYAAAKRLAVMVMEPLRGGSLAGRIPDPVRKIWAEQHPDRTAVDWALRWIWNRPEVTTVLSGMNEPEHVAENARIASQSLPDTMSEAEIELVGRVAEKYRELMPVGCTGCSYCMPCPAGVDIPGCFELYNNSRMFKSRETAELFYLGRMYGLTRAGKASHASLCKDCGVCVKKCPQQLAIPDLLQDVAKEFETPKLKMFYYLGRMYMNVMRWIEVRKGK